MSDYKLLIDGALVDGDADDGRDQSGDRRGAGQVPARLEGAAGRGRRGRAAGVSRPGAATPIAERKAKLAAIADIIQANATELARLLTQEQGKPIADATGEVYGASAFFRYFTTLDLPVKVLDDSETAGSRRTAGRSA